MVLRGVYMFRAQVPRGLVEDILDCCVSVSSQVGRAGWEQDEDWEAGALHRLLKIKLRQVDRS